MSDKIYVGIGKEISTQYGDLLKLSFTAENIETMKKNLDKGWINLAVKKRREPSSSGHTHYLEVDTWKPKNEKPKKPTQEMTEGEFDKLGDDLPF